MNRFFQGALAGTLATAPMTLVMHALHRWPFPERDALPPEQITDRITERAGESVNIDPNLDKTELRALTFLTHFGFGGGAGGVYAILFRRVPAPPMLKGIVWALMVWAGSYVGWIPAAKILPPATRQSKRRNALMIVAHLVWGGVMAMCLENLKPEVSED